MACTCGGEQGWTQFGPNHVTYCTQCHRLQSRPLVDPRVPTLGDHLRALREEISVEEEDAKDPEKVLTCTIESAQRSQHGSEVRVQIMQGDPRWLIEGSRLEGRHADGKVSEDNQTMVRVKKKAGPVLDLDVEDPAWATAPRGHQVVLEPQTNATLYRNLLKAFLIVSRDGADELLAPDRLPKVTPKPVAAKGLRPKQADALAMALGNPENGTVLIQGPPGTGKTFVIARFISEAVARGETVLVCSHTHVAIDNALRKAVKGDRRLAGSILRLGDSGNVAADLVPDRFVAEGLLEVFPAGPGRVLIPRAAEARDVLPEGLREQGWEVDVVEAYRTVQGHPSDADLARATTADIVTFTSSSTVQNFLAVCDTVPPTVACIGPITATTAREHGLDVDVEAEVHTIDGLLDALVAHVR